MAKDVNRSLAKLRVRIGRSPREEKKGGKSWPAWDGSSADVAHNLCVRPLEGRLAVARLAVSVFAIRFARIPTEKRGIRFRCLILPASLFSSSLVLFFFEVSLFLAISFSSFSRCCLFPSLLSLGFSPPVLFCPSDYGYPRSSGLCLWFASLLLVYRFPFFVKAPDTLIRWHLFIHLLATATSVPRPFEI